MSTASVQVGAVRVDPVIANATAINVIANLKIPQDGLFRPATAPDATYLISDQPLIIRIDGAAGVQQCKQVTGCLAKEEK
jgi:filamentous hemagglutinin